MPKRLLELEPTGLFGEDAILTALSGREEMSKPYEFMLTINSPNDKIKPEDVIGKPLAVRIDRDQGQPRYVHGYISHLWAGDFSMSEGQKSLPSRAYRVRLVPWLWFLTRAARCFVYLPQKNRSRSKKCLTKSSSASNRTDTSRPGTMLRRHDLEPAQSRTLRAVSRDRLQFFESDARALWGVLLFQA